LNIIKGYSSLLQSSNEPNPVSTEAVQVIDEMVERGAATVRQLLALARQSELRFEKVDLNDALKKLQTLLTGTFPKNIEIVVQADSKRLQVMVDPNQLHQVLLNISLNARDAMADGGTLRFATEIISGTELRKIFQHAADKPYGCIIVADTGTGIETAVKHRVFEPFFTTKGQGQGSGLGLAVAYGIVANHGGFIDVMSEPGQGAKFCIYLPSVDDSDAVVAPNSITAPGDLRNAPTQGQCVLFVDDEKRQLKVMRRVLEAAGLRVLVAADGVEAVEQFAKHKDEITAVVLDVGLPKMSGWEAFQKMKIIDPTLKPILASGHMSAEIEAAMLKGELRAVLMKPYEVKEIVEAVCAVTRVVQ
jgi:CheY-like chemotaxis protein